MFTIDNNQVKINCKILGGTELIHMKDVKNHLKEATGGDVSTETMHETLTNLFNLTGGAEMVEKELVMSAYNQAGGEEADLVTSEDIDIDNLVGGEQAGGFAGPGATDPRSDSGAQVENVTPAPAAGVRGHLGALIEASGATPAAGGGAANNYLLSNATDLNSVKNYLKATHMTVVNSKVNFNSVSGTGKAKDERIQDFVNSLAKALEENDEATLKDKLIDLYYVNGTNDENRDFLKLLAAQDIDVGANFAGGASGTNFTDTDDADNNDKDAMHAFFKLLFKWDTEDECGKICLVLVALKMFSNMLKPATPIGGIATGAEDKFYMPDSVRKAIAKMLRKHGMVNNTGGAGWDLKKVVEFIKDTRSILKGGASDTFEGPISYSIGGAVGEDLSLTDFLIRSLTHLWSRDYLDNLKIKDALLEAIESGELGSPSEGWGPDDLVPPEDATRELNNWKRVNGRLQHQKDGKNTSLMEHFDSNKGSKGTIGRSSRNMKDANNRPNLNERFDVGCWTLGHSAYDNQACMAQITDGSLWEVDKDTIFNEISPLVAFSIVKSLGFKGVQDTVTGKMKVQSVSSWWSNTCDKTQKAMLCYDQWATTADLKTGTQTAMQTKPSLLKYFKNHKFVSHVVAYINANPDIINVSKETPAMNVDQLTQIPYAKGLSYNTKLEDISGDLRFGLDNYSRSLYSSLDRFGSVFGVGPMFIGGSQGVDLSGGALAAIASPPRFAIKLRAVFESYVKRLAQYKKKLTSETKRQIDELIDNLEAKEKQLRGILQHFRAYSLLVRSENDKAAEYISADKMKEALQQFGAKYGKYRRRVIAAGDILNALNVASMDNSGANLPPALLEK